MANEQILIASPLASAGGKVIAAPFQWTFAGSENFRLRVANSLAGVTVTVQGRYLAPDSTIQSFSESFTPTSDRAVNTHDFAIGAATLLNLVVFASAGSPQRGQCFVQLSVIQGFSGATLLLGTLLQGYVTSFQVLAFPGSPIEASTDGQGWQHVVTAANPPPGTNASLTVPTNVRWQVRSLFARLTTSAAVGNRYPFLDIVAAGVAIAFAPMASVPGPTAVLDMTWAQASAFTAWSDGSSSPTFTVASSGFPGGFALDAGASIVVNIRDINAADQLDAVAAQVEEWLELN